MNQVEYHYIISAVGFIKAYHWREDNEIEAEAGDYFGHCLRAIQGRNGHKVGVLYNAYTEREIAVRMQKNVRPNVEMLFSDSGGLQVVSRGFPVTDALKDEVYESQAKHSTIAMCFDSIPVEVLYTVSNPNFLDNRRFLPDQVDIHARQTARNIKRQIDVFDMRGSKARPNVIMQGNCRDSFQRWADSVVDELGDDYLSRCYGMSLADTAHGLGLRDDVERMYIGSLLQVPDNLAEHIHLLGVGRVRRLMPMVIFANNGFYPKTKKISYDSSTHTRQLTIGFHFMDDVMYNFSKDPMAYRRVESDILTKSKAIFDVDLDPKILADVLLDGARSTHRETNERKSSEYIRDMIKCCVSACLISIDNFNKSVIESTTNPVTMAKAVLDSKSEFFALNQVRSHDDYRYWSANCAHRLSTNKVKVKETITLDDLF